MRLLWKWRSIILAGALLLLSACMREEPRDSAKDAIRIGALYPLSGVDVVVGEDIKAGLELALEIINEDHALPMPLAEGVGLPGKAGRRIELVFRDTRGDPVLASKRLEELVSQERVVAVIGCYHSQVTALASEQAEMLRIPFLNAESTSPVLTQRGLKWLFRTTPDDQMFSQNFFDFLDEMRNKQLLSSSCPLVLVYEDGLWGTSVAQAQQRLAWRREYRVEADVPYSASADNFQQEVEKISRALPGVILQASYARDALAFMKEYRSRALPPFAILGMNAGFVSPELISSLGADAEHVLSREVWAADLSEKKPLVQKVNDFFRMRYHHDMTGHSSRSFTGLMVLAEALDRARGESPEALRKALLQTDLRSDQIIMPWDGIRFDPETGQNTLGKGVIVQVQQGRYVTVWPESLAAKAPVWPALDCIRE